MSVSVSGSVSWSTSISSSDPAGCGFEWRCWRDGREEGVEDGECDFREEDIVVGWRDYLEGMQRRQGQ